MAESSAGETQYAPSHHGADPAHLPPYVSGGGAEGFTHRYTVKTRMKKSPLA